MPRKFSKPRQRQIMKQMGEMLALGAYDKQIQEQLGISMTQFYIYKKKMLAESAQRFMNQKEEDIAFHKELLEQRLGKIYMHLESALRKTNPFNDNLPYIASKDLAAVTNVMRFLAIDLFKLNQEGIKIAKHGGHDYIRNNERVIQTVAGEAGIPLLYNPGKNETVGNGGQGAATATAGQPTTGTILSNAPNIVEQKTEPDESEIY